MKSFKIKHDAYIHQPMHFTLTFLSLGNVLPYKLTEGKDHRQQLILEDSVYFISRHTKNNWGIRRPT